MDEHKKVGAGFGILVLKDGKVLFGKRHDDPEKASSMLHGESTWTMPGGKLHFGESFEEGASRELMEETGLTAESLKVISVSNDIVDTAHFVTVGLLCEDFEDELAVMEPDEITQWEWFDLDDIPKPMFFPSEKLLENYLEKQFYKG